MNRENIEEILKRLGSEDIPEDVRKIAEETSRDFSKTLTQTRQPKHFVLGEYIMKSRLIKIAAAAVIIIGVFAVINFFVGTGSSVALADVLERIEQVQAFMYKVKMTMTGNMMPSMPTGKQEMQGTIIISNEYGMKLEAIMTEPKTGEIMAQQMYVLPSQKVMFMVMPQQKKYTRMEFDDDLLARMKKQNNDPREMIKQIMSCEYTELGRSVIDGVEVEGFETTDPTFMAGMAEDVNVKLWVDVKSWLPVRQELNIKVNEQTQMYGVVYDYQWDIPVDASLFEPVIPEDFTGFPTEGMKMPKMTEEAAVEGLRMFAEFAGKYPKNLNMVTVMQEFGKLKDSQSPAAEQFRQKLEQAESEEEKMTKMMDMFRPVQSLSMFYMVLVQDRREPAYYGESVGPDDADAVLMRWKISEGRYRVIFGDLTAEDVSVEKLAELEKLSFE